jgi:hypothetical protein
MNTRPEGDSGSPEETRSLGDTMTLGAPAPLTAEQLLESMAILSYELEAVLEDIRALVSCVTDPVDTRAGELVSQLKESAFHLEDVLDYLVPDLPVAPEAG